MPYLKAVDVDDRLVEELWGKVNGVGSYYSIADGTTKEVFRRVLFASVLVLRNESVVMRFDDKGEYVELHPMVFKHEFFRHANEAIREAAAAFAGKPICCIIPDGLRGAKRLARVGGMVETGKMIRSLSGVPISCTIFTWR
jgi:hypothetical protein